jgi:transposase-like protein
VGETIYECAEYHHQESILSGTLFQDTHKPLMLWFRAKWYVTSQKTGTKALGLQRVLGLGSHRTAWTSLHKLRRAMVRPGRDRLSGRVEVDETYFGAPRKGGKRGRGAENKVLAAIAVETDDKVVGRIRVGVLADASQSSLRGFIKESVEPESTIVTDGWRGYGGGLEAIGYCHEATGHQDMDSLLPHVHTVISLIRRWIMGTLQGSSSVEHLPYYFDEYTFRYNRESQRAGGCCFTDC